MVRNFVVDPEIAENTFSGGPAHVSKTEIAHMITQKQLLQMARGLGNERAKVKARASNGIKVNLGVAQIRNNDSLAKDAIKVSDLLLNKVQLCPGNNSSKIRKR